MFNLNIKKSKTTNKNHYKTLNNRQFKSKLHLNKHNSTIRLQQLVFHLLLVLLLVFFINFVKQMSDIIKCLSMLILIIKNDVPSIKLNQKFSHNYSFITY